MAYFNIPKAVKAAEADTKVRSAGGYIVTRKVNDFSYQAKEDPRAATGPDILVRRVLQDGTWYDPAYLDNLEEGVLPVDRAAA